jgi:Spy/CpxP family protein refolding chaperone
MKNTFTLLALFATLATPVFAQQATDTTSSAAANSTEMQSEAADSVAVLPGGISVDNDMTVAAGVTSPLPLSLTDDQLEKIAKLKSDFKDGAGPKVVQIRSLQRQMKDMLTQTNVDKSKVLDVQSKINSLKADLSNARLNMRMDTLAILTPDQKQKLRHNSLKRQAFGGHGHGGHRGHHHFGKHGGPGGPAASEDTPKA